MLGHTGRASSLSRSVSAVDAPAERTPSRPTATGPGPRRGLQQPVQGFSSVVRAPNGDFLVMSDNGFGAKNNSADYVLRVYRIDPHFRSRHGGPGTTSVEGFFAHADGFLVKEEIVDLLNIADPHDVGGTGTGIFTFPFTTIESVIPLGSRRIGVLNDNNYPFSAGRTAGQPDDNEFIVIKLDRPLPREGQGHGHDRDEEDED